MLELFVKNLSWDIKREILLFDSRFVLRNNKLIFINKIPSKDERYSMLYKIPKIYSTTYKTYSVILTNNVNNKRFVLGYTSNPSLPIVEYFFYTFTYDYIMKEMNKIPDDTIFYYF